MFKTKKSNISSASKSSPFNDCAAKNATCLYDDESNISTSSKKSKKKKFFDSIRNKISSVLEGKNKSCTSHTSIKASRSKSFEVLSNSFEESHERTSSSEDSILERGKRGSKRSQSVRSKQTISPAEFGTSPQIASNSTRTEFQSDDIEKDRVANNGYRESESNPWINSFISNSSLGTSSSIGPHIDLISEKSPSKSEKDKCLKSNEKENKNKLGINKSNTPSCRPLQNSLLSSPQCKTFNLKEIGVSTLPCFGLDDGECKSLAKEIRELSKYGWYWGPLNRNETEDKLADQPDGAFLVRDSSDVKYLLSLSFRSYGKTLHTRIEHSNGWFSFYPQPDHDSYRSLVDLINHCMSESDGGVFCYSRPLIKGSPSFPVRLTKPVSRFMQVRSLQYLCRFVIRQYTSINHIQNLPIPPKIQGYLKESYY